MRPHPGMTIREAASLIYSDDSGFSKSQIKAGKQLTTAWERFTVNPPIHRITPEMLERFFSDLEEVGITDGAVKKYRETIAAVMTKADAKRHVPKAKRQAESLPDEIDGTLASHFNVTFRRFRLANKAPETDANYRINLRHFDRILGHPATLDDLTDQNILDGMNWLIAKGRSKATANKFKVAICSLWSFLAKRGVVKTWPTVQGFRLPERIPRAWTEKQLESLYDSIAKEKRKIAGLPGALWWTCLHLFFWFSAERLNAALSLRVDDVDLETGYGIVRAETRKYQKGDKTFRLPAEAIPQFRELVAADPEREFLFPTDFCMGTLWNRYSRILKRAGLPQSSKDKFHKMRRSSLSHYDKAGGNATRLADHSDSATTRKSYLDPFITGEPQAADKLFNPFQKREQGL